MRGLSASHSETSSEEFESPMHERRPTADDELRIGGAKAARAEEREFTRHGMICLLRVLPRFVVARLRA